MRSATLRLDDLKTTILNLGFVGENEHRQFRIDCKKMFDEYPHAAASLSVSPPEGESYPAVVERDGDFVIWTITDSDVAVDGDGELQLSFTQEPHLAKTYVGRFKICRSIIPTGDIPSGIDDFITRAGAALTAIPETIDAALEEAKESGEFDGPPGPKGDKGDRGEAGYTPQKGIDYFDGEPGAPGKDGKDGYTPVKGVDYFDGQDGQPGADGFSPSASVSKSGKVATITITDKTGTTTAEITDGEDADPADLIDDTQESDEKTWSSSKIAEDDRALKSQIDQNANSKAPVIINTASGAVASFSDGADGMRVEKLTVSFDADQSGRTGCVVTNYRENLFDKTARNTNNGFISGRWIDRNGSPNTNAEWNTSEYIHIPAETTRTDCFR